MTHKSRLLLSIVLFVFYTFQLKAQLGYQDASMTYMLDEYLKRYDKGISYKEDIVYKGTPYYNPDFLIGNIYDGSKLLASEIALRYNVMEDIIEVKETLNTLDEETKILTKSTTIYVKINSDIFVFVPFKGEIEKGGYFQVLFEGDHFDMYKKIIKKLTPAKKALTSITTDTPAIFQDKQVYYIVTKKGVLYEFPSSKGKKLKVFGKRKDLIKTFTKKNHLNLNKESDLKEVIIYFDSL